MNEFHQKSKVAKDDPPKVAKDDSDDDDITVQLNNAIDKNKEDIKTKAENFRAIEIGTPGSVFISSSIDNHYDLGLKIIKELAETKIKRTRFTNRILPIEVVTKANVEDILNAAGKIFDKYFLKEPSTFAIIFNRKYNKEINRDEIIRELAKLVHEMNHGNKVNLKDPQKTIIVDVLKGFCFLTVLEDYNKYKKFNLHALSLKDEEEKSQENSQSLSKNGEDGNLEKITSSKTEEIASTTEDQNEIKE